MSKRMIFLGNCPREVIEKILAFLDFEDICNLRQTDRATSQKVSHDRFMSFFHSKHVDLTEGALQDFIVAVDTLDVASQIRHLVLVGIANDADAAYANLRKGRKANSRKRSRSQQWREELAQRSDEHKRLHASSKDVALLSEALGKITAKSGRKSLLSLTLDIAVYSNDSEERKPPSSESTPACIWNTAANTFHAAIRALAMSGVSVETLNVFNGDELQQCSLASTELLNLDLKDEALTTVLASLKTLSLSLFNGDLLIWTSDEEHSDESQQTHNGSLRQFLLFCTHLKDLTVHQWYPESYRDLLDGPGRTRGRLLFKLTTEQQKKNSSPPSPPASLPHLQSLSLRGIYVHEPELLAFIKDTTPKNSLLLKDMYMASGTFDSIFSYCTSEDSTLQTLHLSSLTQTGIMIAFKEPDTPYALTDITREGTTNVRRAIEYENALEEEDSPEKREHLAWRRREYGPFVGRRGTRQ